MITHPTIGKVISSLTNLSLIAKTHFGDLDALFTYVYIFIITW
jgi:hypothetical protein